MDAADTPFSFGDGFVSSRMRARVTAQIDELVETGSSRSQVMTWSRADNRWTYFALEWNVIKLAELTKPNFQLLALGQDGSVLASHPAGPVTESIDPTENGPSGRGPLLDLRRIGDHAYVVGMSRQAYRREHTGNWTRQDSGVVQGLGDLEVLGFYSIDGIDEDDIYAVGFSGEIWRRENARWQKLDSPTNVVLHKVRVIASDLIYACGQQGTILRGSNRTWDVIPQDVTNDDVWSIEWFKNTLYAATEHQIFRLRADDILEPVDQGFDHQRTCMYLHANDGVMWSFGTKHLAWTEDALTWNDATP